MLGRDLPERVPWSYDVGGGRGAGVGPGTGVEGVDDDGGHQKSPQPPPAVYRGASHQPKITDFNLAPNGVIPAQTGNFRRARTYAFVVKYRAVKVR